MALDFENNKYDAEFEDSLKFLKIINNLDSVEKEVAKNTIKRLANQYVTIDGLLMAVSIYEDSMRFKLTLSYITFLYIIEHYRILNDSKPTNESLVNLLKDFTFYHPKKKVIPESHCQVFETFEEQYIDMFYTLKKQAIADILSNKSDEQIFKEWHFCLDSSEPF